MSLREKMNNNPAVATGASVVVLLICLMVIYCTFAGGGSTDIDLVYYDAEAKTIKLVRYDPEVLLTSPLANTQTYRAQLFACEECKEVKDGDTLDTLKEKGMFVGYLMRDDPNATTDAMMGEALQFRAVDGTAWVGADTQPGADLVDKILKANCPDGTPKSCGAKPRE